MTMNPCTAAETSTSTLSGASVQSAKGNNFTNIGGSMVKVEQNVKLTVNRYCTAGDGASEVREDAGSNPIVTTNVFDTLATLLGGIFGLLKAKEADLIGSEDISQQSAPDYDTIDHSEPGVTVTEITDMMGSASISLSALDTFNSTVSSLTQSSSSERYIRSMLECNEGYPLYEPEPECQYWQEGVKVGDVGLVTEDGDFDFLFNVCLPTDISTNPAELPDDFEMLRSPEILVKTHFQSKTRLFSNGVKRTVDPNVKYTCSGLEGGVLELPSGAIRFGAKNKLSFKELAIRHAENWYRYTILTRGRDAPNGSLYIVTSCIKCTDWGIAVFNRPSSSEDYLRFITSEQNQNGQSKYWEGAGAYVAKVAPNQDGPGFNDADGPNQCVFLRGYKIMLRKDIWDNSTNSQLTGASHLAVSSYRPHPGTKSESLRQGDSSNQDDLSQSSADNGSGTTRATQNTCSRTDTSARVILYEYSKTSPAHPSDLINAILLCQEPKAKVALTHDDDWCDLLEYHSQILDSEALTKVGSLPYTSNVDEYGCASLKRSDLNPCANVAVVESSSDICATPMSENHLLHPFNPTKQSSAPQLQTGHHLMSATVRSYDNRAFAREDVGVDADDRSFISLQDHSSHHQLANLSTNSQAAVFWEPDSQRPELTPSFPYNRSTNTVAQARPPAQSATTEEPTIKKKRKRADANQLKFLNDTYARTAFPSTEERFHLAKILDMSPRSVQIWFQNKRQSMRQASSGSSKIYTTIPVVPQEDLIIDIVEISPSVYNTDPILADDQYIS